MTEKNLNYQSSHPNNQNKSEPKTQKCYYPKLELVLKTKFSIGFKKKQRFNDGPEFLAILGHFVIQSHKKE